MRLRFSARCFFSSARRLDWMAASKAVLSCDDFGPRRNTKPHWHWTLKPAISGLIRSCSLPQRGHSKERVVMVAIAVQECRVRWTRGNHLTGRHRHRHNPLISGFQFLSSNRSRLSRWSVPGVRRGCKMVGEQQIRWVASAATTQPLYLLLSR